MISEYFFLRSGSVFQGTHSSLLVIGVHPGSHLRGVCATVLPWLSELAPTITSGSFTALALAFVTLRGSPWGDTHGRVGSPGTGPAFSVHHCSLLQSSPLCALVSTWQSAMLLTGKSLRKLQACSLTETVALGYGAFTLFYSLHIRVLW